MKEIRNTRQVTVNEVKFVADDGKEFKVNDEISEAEAERNCRLYEEEQNSKRNLIAFKELKKIVTDFPIQNNEKLIVVLINNFEEWKSLCFYLKNKYYDTICCGFDPLYAQPLSYPTLISIEIENNEFAYRVGCDKTFEKNDNDEIIEKVRTIDGKDYSVYNDHPVLDIVSKMHNQADALKEFVESLNL